ncbi:MAG: WecB/TagA/CpsF family glycosyltransferase [Candidatus Eremiobacteraeota bacterium]|nr:WecB/TagA/CpsF family glycosyltransferase [Candidatus Eremiobacteraeota bacterium]
MVAGEHRRVGSLISKRYMERYRPLQILGSRVDSVSMDDAQQRILELLAQHRFAQVITFGSEMAMLARRDPVYRDVVNAADLVVPDTIGVVYAARLLGQPVRERVAGIELLERVCASCARHQVGVFLLGGAPGVAEQAGAALQRRFAGLLISGTNHGYFPEADDASVIGRIQASGARLILVGLGFPKQELWVRKHAAALGPVVCIGIGGSLDVISGRLQRAPQAMRRLGLEWLYRLCKEPKRLGRQLVLPQFAVLVAGQALRARLSPKR